MSVKSPPSKMHPLNLALRFLLEAAALSLLGTWGYAQSAGLQRWALALGLPLLAAIAWGTFTVPGDPSRGKNGPIPVRGSARLALELLVLGAGPCALRDLGRPALAWALSTLLVLHYASSHRRLQ